MTARPGCPGRIPSSIPSTTSRTSGMYPSPSGRDSKRRSSRCWVTPSRSSAPTAAACLGRLGQAGVGRAPGATAFAIRPRSSGVPRRGPCGGWATRGSAAMRSWRRSKTPTPRIRRGATRIFAYQFHGMDERLELAEPLFELGRDPDFWTRLQAIRTLRQWFYRTKDPALRPADRRDVPRADVRARGRARHAEEPQRGSLHHAR